MSATVVESIVRAAQQRPSALDTMRSRLLSRAELANLPQPTPLIADTLDQGTLALLAGYRGSGKSFIALDWACCVATGRRWQGRPVQQGPVLYLASEGAEGLHLRVSAWEHAWGEVASDLVTLPIPVQLAEDEQREALAQITSDGEYRLIVIDTLARAAVGLDENGARDMGLVVDAVDRIRRVNRATVLLVHHTGKDKTTIRGSSALEAGMDTVYKTGGDAGLIQLQRDKRKDGPQDDRHTLRIKPNSSGSCHIESVREVADMLGSEDKLMSAYLSAFGGVGASKADLRTVADMPTASFHRGLKGLVSRGLLVNTGSDARPFYKQRTEQ